jgi:hypothetical protein
MSSANRTAVERRDDVRPAEVVAAAAPWFAAEALVFQRYWDAPVRSVETDLIWLRRQAFKELYDGVIPRLDEFAVGLAGAADPGSRVMLIDSLEEAREELDHFGRFADAFAQLSGPRLDPASLRVDGNWEANRALAELRARHVRTSGLGGAVAAAFTEGGCCTLYAEGMSRAGRGPHDDVIAAACRPVFEDEVRHMRGALSRVPDEWPASEWERLADLVVEQCQARVRMRDEQFGGPLTADDWVAIEAGTVGPLPEAWNRFGIHAPQGEATTSA